jgi:hypothetical protein
MKRLSVLIAAFSVGALVLAGTAGATKPYMERQVQGEFTLDSTCSFPVLFQPTAPDILNFFIFSDGEIFGAGPFVGTATNLETRKTIKIHSSGTFSVVEHSDGSVTITSDGSVISSLFGTIFYGRIVLTFDANGDLISRTQNGTEEDFCAELAGP